MDLFTQLADTLRPETTTASPINTESISGQNRKVYDFMKEKGTINMIQAHSIGVMHLHSRISDLRNKNGIRVYDRFVKVNGIDMKEYSLTELLIFPKK